MVILFTTSNYPTSWLIRKLTGEDCSHCAIYSEKDYKIVHMNFLGFQSQSPQEFTKHNRVLHYVKLDKSISVEELRAKYGKSKYDFLALLYSGFRILFRQLPKVNLWQTTGMFMCTEFVTEIVNKEEDSLITPHQLYDKLSKENYHG